jgi:hypothetical protein
MSTIQVWVSYKNQIPDSASLTAFEDGGDNFVASATSKFSPFTGNPTKTLGAQSLTAEKSDIAEIITIGKCKCGSIHRADIASVSGMLDENSTNFFCLDCGSAVPLNVKMSEFLAASADESDMNTDDESADDTKTDDDKDAVNSDDDAIKADDKGVEAENKDIHSEDQRIKSDENVKDEDEHEKSADEHEKSANEDVKADDEADVIDDTADDEADVIDDTADDEADVIDDTQDGGENEEVDENVQDDADNASLLDDDEFDAVLAKLVKKASLDLGAAFEELAMDDEGDDSEDGMNDAPDNSEVSESPAPEIAPVNNLPNSESGVVLTPNLDDDTETTPVVSPDSANSLFTGKNENPEGKTLAEIIENPAGEQNAVDGAQLVALDKGVNYKTADIAFVLNAKKTAYIVFADDKPVGTLARSRTHVDNAKVFEDEVFTRAFSNQLVGGLDVSRFGYAPYTVRINAKALRKEFTDKQIADTAKTVSVKFDARLDAIKTSLVTVASAANKGVWADYKNPLRDALVAKLTAIGIEDCAAIVGKVFVDASSEYVETLLSKAIDLANKPAAIREEFKRTVDTANYIVAPSNGSSLGARLASLGTPKEEAPAPVNKLRLVGSDTASVNDTGTFDWKNAFRM